MQRRRIVRIILALVLPIALFASHSALAQEGTREAGKHFQRAVALYGEADYRAALVEFRRAYSLSPNAAVLYNVGETEYQLQDYAGALLTFQRYLGESSPLEVHRSEVESNVEVLRARVGHLTITTSPPGADMTVDDQAIGKTPFDKAVLVSIGHRKVIASMAGHLPVTRYVDVAADDNVTVTLSLPAQNDSSPAPLPLATATDLQRPSRTGHTLRIAGWIAAGALAAGATSFALFAWKESNDLKTARGTYPVSSDTLQHDSSMTKTYSLLADSLTAAAALVGGITLISTLTSSSSSSAPPQGSNPGPRVVLGLASARFETSF